MSETLAEGMRDIPLVEVDISEDRARFFDHDEAIGLASIIAATGLHHPIRVRPAGNRFRLVAGRKRLEAVRLLGWETIPATISAASSDDEARLEEVMENLGRVELTKLDRCRHLFELKQVYERLYPEAKHGGDRGNQYTSGKRQNLPLATCADNSGEVFGLPVTVAEQVGISDRTIRLAVKIWKGLSPASRKRLAGTRFADHQSGLKALSDQSVADQAKILDMLLCDPEGGRQPGVLTVADAMKALENGVVATPMEKKIGQTMASFSRIVKELEDEELDEIVSRYKKPIIASLKRRGHI